MVYQVIPIPLNFITQMKDVNQTLSYNQLVEEAQLNQPLQFGSPIVFKHLYSDKYIAVVPNIEENGSFNISLQNELDIRCIFKVMPKYKSQISGKLSIPYDGNIMLASVYLEQKEQQGGGKNSTEYSDEIFGSYQTQKLSYIAFKQGIQESFKKNVDEVHHKPKTLAGLTIEEEEEEEIDEKNLKSNNIPMNMIEDATISKQHLQMGDLANYSNFLSDLFLQKETGSSFCFNKIKSGVQATDKQSLQCSMIVRINHLQSNSHLESFFENFNLEPSKQNGLLNIEQEYDQLTSNPNIKLNFQQKSDRQTEQMHLSQNSFNTMRVRQAVWKIVSVVQQQRNLISSKDAIYIQCLHSMMFLSYRQEQFQLQKLQTIDSEFLIVPDCDDGNISITKSSLVFLMHKKTGKYISIDTETSSSLLKPIFQTNANEGDCLRLRFLNPEDLIQFNFLDSSQAIIKFCVIYFRKQTKRIQDRISQKDKLDENPDKLISGYFAEIKNQLSLCLNDMTRFCSEFPITEEINAQTLKMYPPNSQSQRLLKEKEIIQLIQLLLDSLLPTRSIIKYVRNVSREEEEILAIPNQDATGGARRRQSSVTGIRISIINAKKEAKPEAKELQRRELREVLLSYYEMVRLIFLFIESFSKQNQENATIALIMFFYFEKYIGFGVGAGHCLNRIIETNPSIRGVVSSGAFRLDKKIDDNLSEFNSVKGEYGDTSHHFTLIDLMFERYQELQQELNLQYWVNFLRFLRNLCVSGGQGNNNNQIVVGMRVFREGSFLNLLIPITSKDNQILTTIPNSQGKQQQIELLALYSEQSDKEDLLEFVDNQLDLFSDLCVGRNYFNIEKIRLFIRAGELARYIRGVDMDDHNDNLRARLVSLALALYIDAEPYTVTTYPKRLYGPYRPKGKSKLFQRQSRFANLQAKARVSSIYTDESTFGKKQKDIEMMSQKALIANISKQFEEIDYEIGKSDGLLTNGHTDELMNFVYTSLSKRIVNQEDLVDLSSFSAKILQLFEKMYSFKLISATEDEQSVKFSLHSYIEKLTRVQQYLPSSVKNLTRDTQGLQAYEIQSNQQQLQSYTMITQYLYDIYFHFNLNEELAYTEEIVYLLRQKSNEKSVLSSSDITQIIKPHFPTLRFSQKEKKPIPDLASFNKDNFLDITLEHFIQQVNEYQSDKRIFDFFVHYMQPRRNIIRNLRRSLVVQTRDEPTMNQLKRLGHELNAQVEGAENLGIKMNLNAQEIQILTTIYDQLKEIHIVIYNEEDGGQVTYTTQNILRHLRIYDCVLNIISHLKTIMKRIDESLALNVKLGESDTLVLNIIRTCFKIILSFISNHNMKNKKLLFERQPTINDYLHMKSYGQFELLTELYQDEPELCQNVPFQIIQALVQKPSYLGHIVLDRLIHAGGFIIQSNISKISKLIFNYQCFYKFLGMVDKDGAYIFDLKIKEGSFEQISMSGHLPYLFQTRALALVRKMHRLTSSQNLFQQQFLQVISAQSLCFFISQEKDLFDSQWSLPNDIVSSRDKACLIVLKTFLKAQVLGVLKEIVFQQEFLLNVPEIIQSLYHFIENEEQRIKLITEESNEGQSLFIQSLDQMEVQEHSLANEGIFTSTGNDPPLPVTTWCVKLVKFILTRQSKEDLYQSEERKESIKDNRNHLELVVKMFKDRQVDRIRNRSESNTELQMHDAPPSLSFNLFYIENILQLVLLINKQLTDQMVKTEGAEEGGANIGRSMSISSQPIRSSSSSQQAVKRSGTMDIKVKQVQQDEQKKVKMLEQLLAKIGSFSWWASDHLTLSLTLEQYIYREQLIIDFTQEFSFNFSRAMEYEFKVDPDYHKKLTLQRVQVQHPSLTSYAQSNYVFDQRLQDIVMQVNQNQNSQTLSTYLLDIQTSGSIRASLLLEERVHMINLIRSSKHFKVFVEKTHGLLRNGIKEILRNDLNARSLRDNACTVLSAIELLQHIVDLEGMDLSEGLERLIKGQQNEANEDVKKRIKYVKGQQLKEELQTYIGELGFFQVFTEFTGSVGPENLDDSYVMSSEEEDQSDEIDQQGNEEGEVLSLLKKSIYRRLFRNLLLLALRLLYGKENVNNNIQNKFISVNKGLKNNVLVKRMAQIIGREIDRQTLINSEIKVSIRHDIQKLQLSHKFNQEYILSSTPHASLNTLFYKLSDKQVKEQDLLLKSDGNFNVLKGLINITSHIKDPFNLGKKKQIYIPDLGEYLVQEDLSYHIVKFTQQLAENHNIECQNYLTNQGLLNNFDILTKIVDLLRSYLNRSLDLAKSTSIDFDKISLSYETHMKIINATDAIKELVQSCQPNQKILCQPNFVKLLTKVLELDDSHAVFRDKIYADLIEQYFAKKKSFAPISMIKTLGSMLTNIAVSTVKDDKQQTEAELFKQSWNQAHMKMIMGYQSRFPQYSKMLAMSFLSSNPSNTKLAMLSQIKEKCTQTLESLLDGDSDLITIIANHIPEEVITKNISYIYEKFKVLYKSGKSYHNDLFEHLNAVPPEHTVDFEIANFVDLCVEACQTPDKSFNAETYYRVGAVLELRSPTSALQDLWKSLIVETAFSLFNLLTIIYTLNDNNAIERIKEHINIERQKKVELYQNKFIVFQVLYFVRDVLQTSGQMVSSLSFAQDLERAFNRDESNLTDKKENQRKLQYRALLFFTKRTGSIEIVIDNILRRVVFPLMPHCFQLTDMIKRDFTDKIDRFSTQTKVESVCNQAEEIIDRLKYEYEFERFYANHTILNLFGTNLALFQQISFILIIIENILVLQALFYCNIIQLALIGMIFSFYLLKTFPHLLRQAQTIIYERRIELAKQREIRTNYLLKSTNSDRGSESDYYLLLQEEYMQSQPWYSRLVYWVSDMEVRFEKIIFDNEMIYYIIFISSASLGLYNPIFLSGLLIDVFWRFPTLTHVINSIWRPKNQIILVLALYLIAQFYYSIVIYWLFYDSYQPNCETIMSCFSFVVDVSLKTDGGFIGWETAKVDGFYDNYALNWQSLIEFSYVFFVIQIIYAIITGIIIDTFGVLRDEAEGIQQDIVGSCLICGIDRGTVDKKSKNKKGFPFHTKYEHNQWNYIYYISYLQDKTKSEFLGQESVIFEKISKSQINWFPLNRAINIPNEMDQTEELAELKDSIDTRLDELDRSLKVIIEKLSQQPRQLNK